MIWASDLVLSPTQHSSKCIQGITKADILSKFFLDLIKNVVSRVLTRQLLMTHNACCKKSQRVTLNRACELKTLEIWSNKIYLKTIWDNFPISNIFHVTKVQYLEHALWCKVWLGCKVWILCNNKSHTYTLRLFNLRHC